MEKKKILLIEDNPDFIVIVSRYLEKAGYSVMTAPDGKSGLEKARKDGPDLIILDLMLPELNGYKVCELLKTDPEYKNIPIIMLTGREEEIEKKVGQEMGADRYLTKSADLEKLIPAVGELLS